MFASIDTIELFASRLVDAITERPAVDEADAGADGTATQPRTHDRMDPDF